MLNRGFTAFVLSNADHSSGVKKPIRRICYWLQLFFCTGGSPTITRRWGTLGVVAAIGATSIVHFATAVGLVTASAWSATFSRLTRTSCGWRKMRNSFCKRWWSVAPSGVPCAEPSSSLPVWWSSTWCQVGPFTLFNSMVFGKFSWRLKLHFLSHHQVWPLTHIYSVDYSLSRIGV